MVEALLQSEELLKQQAKSVFERCDLNRNGQIERDELQMLCESMHERIGLKLLNQIDLGRQLARFDDDFSGGLDPEEFVRLYKHLLQDAVGDAEERIMTLMHVIMMLPMPRAVSSGLRRALPPDPRFIRAILASEQLLQQQAGAVFVQCDRDLNGQIDRDELWGLCAALHEALGLSMQDDVSLGRRLAQFDDDSSGGLDRREFVRLYKELLQDALRREMPSPPSRRFARGDEVLAPYLGESSGRKYHALVTSVVEVGVEVLVGLRWLRPPAGLHPEEYVSGNGLDDTLCTRVPAELVEMKTSECPIDQVTLTVGTLEHGRVEAELDRRSPLSI
ncbi:hypothetical protein AK812_SmicGene639 [Symbiodinium microadriaticum]|uniref:EF-hand domain-containing protein n=1 Tax=Symbiodinium microadriaticum TaxID=2951 RepID=A0A1Q9F6B3_SYMMI|nr:hypothetical protein AK812_SmicGene639 [Symbiodinium microadriaticum]